MMIDRLNQMNRPVNRAKPITGALKTLAAYAALFYIAMQISML